MVKIPVSDRLRQEIETDYLIFEILYLKGPKKHQIRYVQYGFGREMNK